MNYSIVLGCEWPDHFLGMSGLEQFRMAVVWFIRVSQWHSTPRHCCNCSFALKVRHKVYPNDMGNVWKHTKSTTRKKNNIPLSPPPLFGWSRCVWSKSPNENISPTICLYACWKELFSRVCARSLRIECVWEFLYLLKRIQRNRRGQEILLNGKAMCLCQCVSIFVRQQGKGRGHPQASWAAKA